MLRLVFRSARLTVNATSFAVNASPSCHLTPGWRWNVQVRPSGLTSHVSARSGTGFHEEPSAAHSRSSSLSNISWNATPWLKVSCEAGCQIAVRSPSQCIWSVSVTPPPPLAAVDGAALTAGALAAGGALAGGAPEVLGAAADPHAAKARAATARMARPRVRMGSLLRVPWGAC